MSRNHGWSAFPAAQNRVTIPNIEAGHLRCAMTGSAVLLQNGHGRFRRHPNWYSPSIAAAAAETLTANIALLRHERSLED